MKVPEANENREKRERVAAFFDLDGTLMPGPSLEKRFFRVLRYRREIRVANYFQWAEKALRLLPRGIPQIVNANKMYLRGVQSFYEHGQVDSHISPWHTNGHQAWGLASTPPRRNPRLPVPVFFADALDRLEWHARQGHAIFIVSGTLEPLARQAARALEAELARRGAAVEIGVCATRLVENNGRWTGRIVGEAMFGSAKARAIRRIVMELGLELSQCFAYGNSASDREMLAAVGRPAAVNPSPGLARIARRKQWPVLRWDKEKDSAQKARRTQRSQKSDKTKEIGRGLQSSCVNAGNGK